MTLLGQQISRNHDFAVAGPGGVKHPVEEA
jgi:hypothetical protein